MPGRETVRRMAEAELVGSVRSVDDELDDARLRLLEALKESERELMEETLELLGKEDLSVGDVREGMLVRKLLVNLMAGGDGVSNNSLGHLLRLSGVQRGGPKKVLVEKGLDVTELLDQLGSG